jgi:hypothetical protein
MYKKRIAAWDISEKETFETTQAGGNKREKSVATPA